MSTRKSKERMMESRTYRYQNLMRLIFQLAKENGLVVFFPDYHWQEGDPNTVLLYTPDDAEYNHQMDVDSIKNGMYVTEEMYRRPVWTFQSTDQNGLFSYEFANFGALDLRIGKAEQSIREAIKTAIDVRKNKEEEERRKRMTNYEGSVSMYLYTLYDYEEAPLLFVTLPEQMTAEQKVELLSYVNVECYGDTGQETPDWAMEYGLWVRSVLLDNSIPLNTQKLELSDVGVADITTILGEGTENAGVYKRCMGNLPQLVYAAAAAYDRDPDIYEGFCVTFTESGWFGMEVSC